MHFISVYTPYKHNHEHFWTHFSKKFSELCERFLVILALCATLCQFMQNFYRNQFKVSKMHRNKPFWQYSSLLNLLSHYLGLLPKEINVAGNNPPLIRVLVRPDTQYIKALSCFCWGRIFLGNYDIITRVTKNGQGGFPISISRLESG